jgi:hypothetical protein
MSGMRIGGEPGGSSKNVLRSFSNPGSRNEPRTFSNASEEPSPFARLLRGLGREVDHGERMVRRAIDGGGKDLGPGELLALQAGVYRYSEAVDLSAKLVDRATSGVKTVLQGQ